MMHKANIHNTCGMQANMPYHPAAMAQLPPLGSPGQGGAAVSGPSGSQRQPLGGVKRPGSGTRELALEALGQGSGGGVPAALAEIGRAHV